MLPFALLRRVLVLHAELLLINYLHVLLCHYIQLSQNRFPSRKLILIPDLLRNQLFIYKYRLNLNQEHSSYLHLLKSCSMHDVEETTYYVGYKTSYIGYFLYLILNWC